MRTGATRRAKLQSDRHHQQINTQRFTGRMPFLSLNQQCQSTQGKEVELIISTAIPNHLQNNKKAAAELNNSSLAHSLTSYFLY